MCGGGGSVNETAEVDETTRRQPDPFLRSIQQQYLQNIPSAPSGPMVAPFAPQSLLANRLTTQFATDPRSYDATNLANISSAIAQSPALANTVQGQLQTLNTISAAENLDPRSNPFVAAAADAANRQTIGTLVNDVLPNIRGSAVSAGQFGGSRQGIAEGQAVSGAAQAIADTTARHYFGQYNQNVQNAIAAASQTPATLLLPQQAIGQAINDRNAANQQAMQVLDSLDKAGQQLSNKQQQIIDGELRRFATNTQLPLQVISSVGGLTSGGTVTRTGTTTTGAPAPQISPLQGAVGGGLAGASLGATLGGTTLGGLTLPAAPWFAVGGAALGLLSSI